MVSLVLESKVTTVVRWCIFDKFSKGWNIKISSFECAICIKIKKETWKQSEGTWEKVNVKSLLHKWFG